MTEHQRVSIPHRYAKNAGCVPGLCAGIRFQFLIGTLKTLNKYHCLLMMNRFQFLIGTLKTYLHPFPFSHFS